MTDGDAALSAGQRTAISGVLVAVALFAMVDVWSDLGSGATLRHVGSEIGLAGLAIAGLGVLWARYFHLRLDLSETRRSLEGAHSEAQLWRERHAQVLSGLSRAIEDQLDAWGLTAAEKEVALLLLKGLSFKEIAAVRNASERTVRQQALAVYAKAGLAGRAELSAFFLEDLLGPPPSVQNGAQS